MKFQLEEQVIENKKYNIKYRQYYIVQCKRAIADRGQTHNKTSFDVVQINTSSYNNFAAFEALNYLVLIITSDQIPVSISFMEISFLEKSWSRKKDKYNTNFLQMVKSGIQK